MSILILGINSQATFDMIDMGDNENLDQYTTLLELEWFVNNNGIINNKTQKIIISNDEYEFHIPLNKGIINAYIEVPNFSSNNNKNDGSNSMMLNSL